MKTLCSALLLLCPLGLEPLPGHPSGVCRVAFSPDGALLAAGGSASVVTVWDVASRRVRHALQGGGHEGSLAFSPDGRFLTAGSSDGRVRIWNLADGALAAVLDHVPAPLPAQNVYAVAYNAEGTLLASGGGVRSVIRLWDPATGRLDRSLGTFGSAVFCLAFSPDGTRLIAGSEDGKLRVYNLASGLSEFDATAHVGGVRCLAISPDGRSAASGGVDRLVRLWEIDGGRLREKKVLKGHSDMVLGVAYSADGKQLVSSSPDGTARTWDAGRGAAGRVLHRGRAGVRSAVFGPGGTTALGLWTDGSKEPNVLLGDAGIATVDRR